MKLYSLVFIALRTVNENTEIRVNPLLVIQESQDAALEEAREALMSLFPPSDHWGNHQMFWLEIEQGLPFDDGRRLVWQIEEPLQNSEAPHGEDNTNTE
jgi:hypothetical protein